MKGQKATRKFNPSMRITGVSVTGESVESISVFSLLKITPMQMKTKKDFTAIARTCKIQGYVFGRKKRNTTTANMRKSLVVTDIFS
jgi:hypothetical protein